MMLVASLPVIVQGYTVAPDLNSMRRHVFSLRSFPDGGDSSTDSPIMPTTIPVVRSPVDAPPTTAEFGQVVRRRPSSANGSDRSERDLFASSVSASSTSSSSSPLSSETTSPSLESIRRRNFGTAIVAIAVAILNYAWQYTHPYNPTQLLAQMQASSSDLSVIGKNGRPTLVDFWAPWCENCKIEAATLEQIHQEYDGRVNFVMINGDDTSPKSWMAIETFGVDVVPHMALVNRHGEVETALVGIVPKHVIEADLDSLLSDEEEEPSSNVQSGIRQLPYVMLDTFASRPEQRKLHFDE